MPGGALAGRSKPLVRTNTRAADGFASLPDRGELVVYDRGKTKVSGAYSAYPVRLSEAHALSAAYFGGQMTIEAPNGEAIKLAYERHIEHPDGNWTWIGRDASGADAVITFGDKAAFGTIPLEGEESLRLTMDGGSAWLVATDRRKLPESATMQSGKPDYFIPPQAAEGAISGKAAAPAGSQAQSITAAAVGGPTVDVVLGYTTGLAAALGGNSQAVTRLTNLVDITNQAYANSAVNATLRLVATVSVSYEDATDNGETLEQLSGYKSGTGPITPHPAFAALRTARKTYGGDLVALVRDFRTPQNNGCGIAWLIGGGQSGMDQGDEPFGYSVVSDGSDVDEGDGQTYFCRDESFAHELGHNMGQAHNVDDSGGGSGLHAYSYGYRETSSNGFFTVMAYRASGSNQFGIRHFANPNVAYSGRPTGVANASDNARSMNQSIPIVATFRGTVVPDPNSLFVGAIKGMNGKCLDAYYPGTELRTPIQVYDCNGARQQQWKLNLGAAGNISSVGTSRVLDVIGYGTANGSQLQLWDPSGNLNQGWYLARAAVIGIGEKVLDAEGTSSANGTKIQLWQSNGGFHQMWYYDARTQWLVGKDGKCLDVEGLSTANGARVQLYTCTNYGNQRWQLGPNGTIRGYGGKCLEAANGSSANGTKVQMWDCNGGAHQRWRWRGEIRSILSDKCLDDPGLGQINASRVHIWACHGGDNQRWEYLSP